MTAAAVAVRERPILFSAENVRAILAGKKSQTRRVMLPQPPRCVTSFMDLGCFKPCISIGAAGWDGVLGSPAHRAALAEIDAFDNECRRCPYGVVGERLWVRESFSYREYDPEIINDLDPMFWYWADGNPTRGDFTKPKPSIHMPRHASRLTLELTDVRVERLQDISGEDCQAEGVRIPCDPKTGNVLLDMGSRYAPARYLTSETLHEPRALYRAHFASLFDSLNAKRGYPWDTNPWVWCLSFSVVRP